MSAEEIVFRVASTSALGEFTRRHAHVTLSLWCDWTREVLEVVGATEAEAGALVEALRPHAPRIEAYAIDAATRVVVMDCVDLPHDLVNVAIDKAGCVNLPPTRIERGWETFTVLATSDARARDVLDDLRAASRGVELVSRAPLRVQALLNARGAGVSAVLDTLTDKQLEAIVLAERHGLYDSPRLTTAASVADAVGVSRSTYEEHLRKAESKLVRRLLPYLELQLKARKAAAAARAAPPPAPPSPPEPPASPAREAEAAKQA